MSQTQTEYKTARKYHDALDDLLDRPISYNPAFKKITGRTSAAVWLSQQWYWAKRTKDPNGWVYKSAKECTEETGLTDNEQHTARMICKKLGVIEEKLKGVPATMHYRIVKEKIYELLGVQFPTKQETEIPIERETEFPAESETSLNDGSEFPEKQESDGVGNFNTSNTATTTPEIKKKDLLDGILQLQLKPKSIQDAIRNHFKLTPNWGMKTNRQFMEWAVSENITAEQIKLAAQVWGSDKRFNWAHPSLKGIQEHWLQLIEGNTNGKQDPYNQPVLEGEELEAKRREVAAMFAGSPAPARQSGGS